MRAFEIAVNGERLITAGVSDWALLSAHINAQRAFQEHRIPETIGFTMGGMSETETDGFSRHFRWKGQNLSVGDVVSIRIVDVENVDPPVKRYRSDHEVQEDCFSEEELRQFRHEDYLRLKAEFETD